MKKKLSILFTTIFITIMIFIAITYKYNIVHSITQLFLSDEVINKFYVYIWYIPNNIQSVALLILYIIAIVSLLLAIKFSSIDFKVPSMIIGSILVGVIAVYTLISIIKVPLLFISIYLNIPLINMFEIFEGVRPGGIFIIKVVTFVFLTVSLLSSNVEKKYAFVLIVAIILILLQSNVYSFVNTYSAFPSANLYIVRVLTILNNPLKLFIDHLLVGFGLCSIITIIKFYNTDIENINTNRHVNNSCLFTFIVPNIFALAYSFVSFILVLVNFII